MRSILAWATACLCVGVCVSAQAAAAEQSKVVALVEHEAKQCALYLKLPANWTLEEKHDDGACLVAAREPAHGSRCGKTGDEKVLCDSERQANVSIRPGSIDEAATWAPLDLFPFQFDEGKWGYTNGHASERDAVLLQRKPRQILYADYATREHYDDGTYCCTGRNWWAMVDLPAHRLAIIEVTWDFIAWDEDTMAWSDVTDAKAKNNFEQFLQALR